MKLLILVPFVAIISATPIECRGFWHCMYMFSRASTKKYACFPRHYHSACYGYSSHLINISIREVWISDTYSIPHHTNFLAFNCKNMIPVCQSKIYPLCSLSDSITDSPAWKLIKGGRPHVCMLFWARSMHYELARVGMEHFSFFSTVWLRSADKVMLDDHDFPIYKKVLVNWTRICTLHIDLEDSLILFMIKWQYRFVQPCLELWLQNWYPI